MTERILSIKCAVEKNLGGMARHVTSTAVIEVFEGDLIWEGVVETFALTAIHTSSAVTASRIVKTIVWGMQPLPKLTR